MPNLNVPSFTRSKDMTGRRNLTSSSAIAERPRHARVTSIRKIEVEFLSHPLGA